MSSFGLSKSAKAVAMIYAISLLGLFFYIYTRPEQAIQQAHAIYNDVLDLIQPIDPSSERYRLKIHHAVINEDASFLKKVCVADKVDDQEESKMDNVRPYNHFNPQTQKIVCDLEQETKEFTPLMSAYFGKKIQMAELLLDFGANPNHVNHNHTLLMLAVDRNEIEWVELLLMYKADTNIPEPDSGYSPLMLASYNDHLEIAYYLLKFGANLDYQVPKSGVTALMLAAASGHEKMLKLLLASGANSFIEDKNERTAMEIAKVNGHRDLELILTNHMNELTKDQEFPPASSSRPTSTGKEGEL